MIRTAIMTKNQPEKFPAFEIERGDEKKKIMGLMRSRLKKIQNHTNLSRLTLLTRALLFILAYPEVDKYHLAGYLNESIGNVRKITSVLKESDLITIVCQPGKERVFIPNIKVSKSATAKIKKEIIRLRKETKYILIPRIKSYSRRETEIREKHRKEEIDKIVDLFAKATKAKNTVPLSAIKSLLDVKDEQEMETLLRVLAWDLNTRLAKKREEPVIRLVIHRSWDNNKGWLELEVKNTSANTGNE